MSSTTLEADAPIITESPEVSTGNQANQIDARLQTRRLISTTNSQTREFDIMVIDSADKWDEATSFHSEYTMPILGSNKKLRFKLQGISYADWAKIEAANQIPDWTGEGEPSAEFTHQLDYIAMCKNVAFFELSTGKKIPGNTPKDKVDFLSERNPGEINALFTFLTDKACALKDGLLLADYEAFSRQAILPEVVEIEDFNSWSKASDSQYFFRMQRPFQDYILEFPIKGIDKDVRKRIDDETKFPSPPQTLARRPGGKGFDPSQIVYDNKDPSYIKSCNAIEQKRTLLFMEQCLLFPIPGSTTKEKYDWLSKRLVGDVFRLRSFIQNDLLSYRNRYDVFSAS